MFHAPGQNALTNYRKCLQSAWADATADHIKSMFPVDVLKTWNGLQQSMNTCINCFADCVEVMQGEVFRVLVFNRSYMSSEHTKVVDDMKSVIDSSFAIDDAKTCHSDRINSGRVQADLRRGGSDQMYRESV